MLGTEWDEALASGYSAIDDQHRELFSRMNLLAESMCKGRGKEEVGKTLEFLGQYVVYHFKTEEEYMKKSGYRGFIEHMSEHAQFTRDLMSIKNRASAGGEDSVIAMDVILGLADWVRKHIRRTDLRMCAFLKDSLRKGAD